MSVSDRQSSIELEQSCSTPATPPSSNSSVPIVFFDVETSIPCKVGQGYHLLEFGAIIVCPKRLVELASYSTLIRPLDLSVVSAASVRCNGITRESLISAPEFVQVADRIFGTLHGKIWAGHNILRFDCLRIREAFELIGRSAPEPVGTIDSLRLLSDRFGKRAGNMKMATLANYFGLGKQTHRSLDDVRMNLEVLKHCAAVLFLESSLTDSTLAVKNPPKFCHRKTVSPIPMNTLPSIPSSCPSSAEQNTPIVNSLTLLIGGMRLDSEPTVISNELSTSEDSNLSCGFLEPEMVSVSCLQVDTQNLCQSGAQVLIMHKDIALKIFSAGLKVVFGVSTKFTDYAGRPKLSIVVTAPANVCSLLNQCDDLARKVLLESGSSSEWRAVIRHASPVSPTFRLQIPSVENCDTGHSTEIHQRDISGRTRKLVFGKSAVEELQSLLSPGTLIDAYFCPKVYDYQQNSGVRLIAERLIIHSKKSILEQ